MRKGSPSFKFKYELFFAFCVIIIIPLIFVVFIHSRQISKTTEEHHVEFMQHVTDQLKKNIENSIKDIDKIQFFYLYDYDLLKILKKKRPENKNEYEEYLKDNIRMTKYLNNVIGTNDNIVTVLIHTNNGNEFSVPESFNIDDEIKLRLDRYSKSRPKELFLVLTGQYQYVSSVKDVITIGRGCVDPNTNKVIGYSIVNISYRIFENLFENLNTDSRMNVFVHNGEKILYHSKKNSVNEEDLKDIIHQSSKKSIEFQADISGEKYLLVSNYSEYTGLNVVEYIPLSFVNESAVINSESYWAMTLVIMVLAIILSATIAYRISYPISRLEKAMTSLRERKKFDVISNQAATREMWSLTQSYNATVLATKEWLEKEQQYQINKTKLELMTLELQINPHFLYNTLSLISSKAYVNEQPEIEEVTKYLSELLRFNLKEKQMVNISEELEQVKRYLQIQKMGLSREFIVVYDVDERFNKQCILKATIQPLVENAIVHGFQNKSEYDLLKISAISDGSDLIIGVTDNGKGINEAKVKEINELLKQPIDVHLLSDGKRHIGLVNVHYRLCQKFGEKYGLLLESIEGIGTTVYIRLPVQLEE